jgi:hypothetical protein
MDSQKAKQLELHWEQVSPSSAFVEVGRKRNAAASRSAMLNAFRAKSSNRKIKAMAPVSL